MNPEFHCSERLCFPKDYQSVRAFSYTEYHIKPHNHNFYEMNIVLGGRGTHQIESVRIPVTRGDVFVIPPMVVHSYDNTEHLEVYHVLLRNDFIRRHSEEATRVPGYVHLMEIEPYLRKRSDEHLFLHLSPTQISEIEKDFKFIEDDGEFGGEELSALRNHAAWRLIYYLSTLLSIQLKSSAGKVEKKYTQQIIEVLEYIHQSFSEKMTVEGLAERAYLSRSTFIRAFLSVCGCAPMQYVNRYRTAKARDLLLDKSLQKTEVAHLCGFYDLSHLERFLKKY